MSLLDALRDILKKEEESQKKAESSTPTKETQNKDDTQKSDVVAELKAKLETQQKEIDALKAKQDSSPGDKSKDQGSDTQAKDPSASAFAPHQQKDAITPEMMKTLADTPENREFLIKNMDAARQAVAQLGNA